MEKYEKLEQIGSGVSSIVYKALNRETNEIVCLKEIKDLGPESEGIPCFVIRECSFLKEMEHDNIIRLLDVAVNLEIGKAYMVFEYMEFDLKKFMETHLEIAKDPQFIKRFLHQILSGLAYCHSHKIIHRDLKPMNLLVDIHGRILKLADFGLAKAVDVPRQSYTGGNLQGTLPYMAPEVMKQSENTFASDIWSVGCIFAEMCKQEPLFVGSTPWEVVKRIFSLLGKPDERIWPGGTPLMETGFLIEDNPKNFAELFPNLEAAGVDLLSKMVCYTDRITVYDALNHPYFEGR